MNNNRDKGYIDKIRPEKIISAICCVRRLDTETIGIYWKADRSERSSQTWNMAS